jgi:archaellin
MGRLFITGLTGSILLISLILIGITVGSAITGETLGGTTEEDYQHMVDEVINQISTYLQIKDQKGKYCNMEGVQKIEKIALWISPLFSQDIDVSQLTIQLDDGKNVIMLTYDGNAEAMRPYSLFEHPIWDNLTGANFGFASVVDLDGSLVNYDIINENSDNAYVLIRLPECMMFSKGESLTITLFPSTGIVRTIMLKAPPPIKSVVTFE